MKREIVKDPVMGEIVKFLFDGTLSPMWPSTNKRKLTHCIMFTRGKKDCVGERHTNTVSKNVLFQFKL